ncbi:homocitrate synthase/isopropylmalate synthase family protein, partial [Staphylococcus epidermidis]
MSTYPPIPLPTNKPIVPQNPFTHQSPIHQHALLKHPQTYQIITPQLLPLNTTQFPLPKFSGKHPFPQNLKPLPYQIKFQHQLTLFKQFKQIARNKKNLS